MVNLFLNFILNSFSNNLFFSELACLLCLFSLSYITIAAVSMAVFRIRHMTDNTIAMVPEHGYVNSTNYSADSIRWLDYLGFKEEIFIHHALNGLGEKKIAGISIDGFCSVSNTVYQYNVSSITFFNNLFLL